MFVSRVTAKADSYCKLQNYTIFSDCDRNGSSYASTNRSSPKAVVILEIQVILSVHLAAFEVTVAENS